MAFLPVWIDLYILKHEGILKLYYKPETLKPIKLGPIVKTILKFLGFAVVLAILAALRVLLEVSDLSAAPHWAFYPLFAGALALPFLGLWFLIHSIDTRGEKFTPDHEEALLKKVGANSPEYAKFKEQQRQINSIESQKSAQFLRRMFKGLGILMAIMVLIMLSVTFLPRIISMPLAILALVGIPVGLIANLVIASRSKLPDEFASLNDALNRADYTAAKAFVENVLAKLPPLEANYTAARAYASSGDLARAEELCREALRLILAQEAHERNKKLFAQYLGLLGAILVGAGRYQEAEEFLQQGAKLEQGEAHIFISLAEMLLLQNWSPELALDYLEEAFVINEKKLEGERAPMPVAQVLKAWALSRLGKTSEAQALAESALAFADNASVSTKAELHYYAGRLALAQENKSAAETAFKTVIRLDPNGIMAKYAKQLLSQMS
jgi:tetratricopeptide (TPR) repeat protein